MKKLATRNFSNLGFGLSIIVMLIVVVFAAINLRALIESNSKVSHTLIVLRTLDKTLALLTDSETGQRGYIITGEERFLEAYNAAVSPNNGISQYLRELRQLTSDNPNQQQRLDLLDPLVTEKLAFIQETIDLRRNEGFDAAQNAVLTDKGRQIMDNIRQLLAEMQNEEEELLQQRSNAAFASLQNTLLTLVIGAGLSISLLSLSYYMVNREVNVRRRAEEALQQLNRELDNRVEQRTAELAAASERYINTLDNILEGCQIIGLDWRYLYVNNAVARQGRRTREELLGHTMMEMYPGIESTELFAILRRCMEERIPFHWDNKFTYPDGSTGWFELSLQPVPEGVFILSIDISERKRAEAAVAATLKRFQSLIEHAPDGIALLGQDGRLRQITPSTEHILGYMLDEAESQDPALLTHPDNLPDLLTLLNDLIQNPDKVAITQYRFRHKDGSWRWLESTISNLIAEPSVEAIVFNYRDITERKQAEDQLNYHARLLRHINDAVIATDDQLRITAWNRAAEKMYGWPSKEVMGHNLSEILSFELTDEQRAEARELLNESMASRSERIHHRRDGRTIYVETNTIALLNQQGRMTGYVSVHRDITERKRAEEQTQLQLQRLKSLRAIDIAISSSFDLHLTLDVLLDQVIAQLNADAAAVLLFHPVTRTLEYSASRGFRSTAIREARVSLGEGYAGKAILERRMLHVPNLMETENELPRAFLLMLKEEAFIEYYCVPLIVKGEVKGVLEIFHRGALPGGLEWLDFLETLAGQAAIAIEDSTLFENLQRSNRELFQAYDATIEGWSHALDLRDKETEGHTQRVTKMTLDLARRFGFTDEQLVHIRWGALLHDIGKMGVPDNILLKPDKLTEAEWEIMKKHPTFALEMLSPIAYLKSCLDIPYCHHEKWDGSGYPRGLKGEVIPLAARLFAVVDVWDALRSDRPYRAGWSVEKTIEHIRSQSGSHFDPKVVEDFLEMVEQPNR